ncbi:hypothetical protein L3Q82_018656 [Scortum barcoo]|uniref:Uncharacterized protein n=1 Tax=Scortum barcoo TaxID=214431 RepID=A0ACB8VER7_9TELE|nr:hypothetical protein L3Q82_018656 [Scortum barcoo]
MKLDSLVTVAESRTLDKLLDIMDNASHPLHTVISNQRSLFSERLLLPKCRTNRLNAHTGASRLHRGPHLEPGLGLGLAGERLVAGSLPTGPAGLSRNGGVGPPSK